MSTGSPTVSLRAVNARPHDPLRVKQGMNKERTLAGRTLLFPEQHSEVPPPHKRARTDTPQRADAVDMASGDRLDSPQDDASLALLLCDEELTEPVRGDRLDSPQDDASLAMLLCDEELTEPVRGEDASRQSMPEYGVELIGSFYLHMKGSATSAMSDPTLAHAMLLWFAVVDKPFLEFDCLRTETMALTCVGLAYKLSETACTFGFSHLRVIAKNCAHVHGAFSMFCKFDGCWQTRLLRTAEAYLLKALEWRVAMLPMMSCVIDQLTSTVGGSERVLHVRNIAAAVYKAGEQTCAQSVECV